LPGLAGGRLGAGRGGAGEGRALTVLGQLLPPCPSPPWPSREELLYLGQELSITW